MQYKYFYKHFKGLELNTYMTEHLMWRQQSIVTPVRPRNTCKSRSPPSGAPEWSEGCPLQMHGKAGTTQKDHQNHRVNFCMLTYCHQLIGYNNYCNGDK